MNLKGKAFLKYFLSISIPVMVQQLQTQLLSICDTVMLGLVSTDAISGVTVANKLYFIYSLALFGLTNGVGIFITQFYGANDKKHYNLIFRFGLKVSLLVGTVVTVFSFVCRRQFIMLFVQSSQVINFGTTYLTIVAFSFIPAAVSAMCALFLRVTGQPKIPARVGFIVVLLNIVLNTILIFGYLGFPALGVAGAAYATAISRFAEMLLLLRAIAARREEKTFSGNGEPLPISEKFLILKKTAPLILNEVVWALGLNLIFLNYCYVDEFYIPALTVVDNINSVIYVVFSGCAAATGIIVGSSLGSGDLALAKRNAQKMIKIGIAVYGIGSLFVLVTSPLSPRLFSITGELLQVSSWMLIIRSGVNFVKGYSETIYYILRAGGDTKAVFIVDGLFILLGPLLMSTIFSRLFQFELIIVFAVVEGIYLLKVFIANYLYKKGNWLKSRTS